MLGLANSDLDQAKQLLLSGDVVAIPTETVYGLAASIQFEDAIRKIFTLKQRPFFDPLIVHVSSITQAKSLSTDWSPLTDFVARMFWPGPLTLILPKAAHVNSLITAGLDTVAVRFPKHDIALELIEHVGPLAAPSANKFGKTSPSMAHHVSEEFSGTNLLVVDGGPCQIGIESTVLSIDASDSVISILRPGGITSENLTNALKKWSKPVKVERNSSHRSPGHTAHHYMPKLPLILVTEGEDLGLSLTRFSVELGSELKNPYILKLSQSPEIAARELYAKLRIPQKPEYDSILFALPLTAAGNASWDGIIDRITRAAKVRSETYEKSISR